MNITYFMLETKRPRDDFDLFWLYFARLHSMLATQERINYESISII